MSYSYQINIKKQIIDPILKIKLHSCDLIFIKNLLVDRLNILNSDAVNDFKDFSQKLNKSKQSLQFRALTVLYLLIYFHNSKFSLPREYG